MPVNPSRVPVICAVGEVNNRPSRPEVGLDPVGLMIAALRAAAADGGGGWVGALDRLLVTPQISFRGLDTVGLLAERLQMPAKRIIQAREASGDTPIRHLNDAANAIGSGEAQVVAVTGGEALRTAAARARAAGEGAALFQGSIASASPLRRRDGLLTPSAIYPLYETACRATWGQTLAQAQAETGEIWSRMSAVAAQAQGAWLKTPRTPEEIVEPSDGNRPIAHPYLKLMVANASVNQGAAFIVTSLDRALQAGLGEDRLVYVLPGATAHEAADPLERSDWTTPPGMKVALRRALAINGLTVEHLDAVELYSCFPCVPKMARRVIGWPVERPVSVHGGLSFGGGPIGNYMSHAVAAMTRRLRRTGANGLLYANGGYCTHNHAIVLSRRPPDGHAFPHAYDFQTEADARRGAVPPLGDDYEGSAELVTCTVIYDAQGAPSYGVVLVRTPAGARVIAWVNGEDALTIAFLTDGEREPVGRLGETRRTDDKLRWRPAAP